MADPALLYSLATLIISTCFGVGCVLACWKWASAATPRRKQPASEPATPTSGQLAQLQADQAELFASLEKISQTMKRLSSRAAVQDHRARRNESDSNSPAPPVGASKDDLRRHYIPGMNHQEVARAAQARIAKETN